MAMIPRLLFVLMLIVGPIVVWATSSGLPARVATHFGRGGFANGWMTHDGYIAFMFLMVVLVPLVVVAGIGLIPRFATSRISLPHRQYWLSPERREATVGWLASHGCAMGILLILFMLGIHFLTLEANARSPARLDEAEFITVLAAFLVLLAIWIVAIALRFRSQR
jgi:uncharacterized membrane protein